MAKSAKLKGVLTLDNQPFIKGLRQSMTFAKAAAKQFANQPFRTSMIIAYKGGAAGVSGIASGLVKMGDLGMKAFKIVTAGALVAGAAIAAGVVHAFNLGSAMIDLSARTGTAIGRLLIMQTALKDAGVEADEVGAVVNKMQKFISKAGEEGSAAADRLQSLHLSFAQIQDLTPDRQFEAIGKAIAGIESPTERTAAAMEIFGKSGGKLQSFFNDTKNGGLNSAAAVVGKQAGILEKNAAIFDKVSDQLGHAGTKLQGFFIGVADRVVSALSPLLDRLDEIDLAGMGQDFGDGITKGAEAIMGAFKDPSLIGDFVADGFDYGMKAAGNMMIATFTTGIEFFKDGFIEMLAGVGQIIIATLVDAFSYPIAYFQARIEKAIQSLPVALGGARIKTPEDVEKRAELVKELQQLTKEYLADLKDPRLMDEKQNPGYTHEELVKNVQDQMFPRLQKRRELIAEIDQSEDEIDVAKRAQELRDSGVKFGGKTAGEWRSEGTGNLNAGMGKAIEKARGMKVDDVLGAGAAKAKMAAVVTKAVEKGKTVMPQPVPMIDGKPISQGYLNQLISSYGREAAYRMVYGEAAGGKMYEQQVPPMSAGRRNQLISTFGREAVEQAEASGADLRTYKFGGKTPGGVVPTQSVGRIGISGNEAGRPDAAGFDENGVHQMSQGYHMIRRGDSARAKAAAAEAKKAQDPLLKAQQATAKNTAALAKTWGANGSEE